MNWFHGSGDPRSHYRTFLGMTAAGFLCLATVVGAITGISRDAGSAAPAAQSPAAAPVAGGGLFTEITQKASPAVVWIQVEKTEPQTNLSAPFGGSSEQEELLRRFFGDRLPKFEMPEQPRHSEGQGSGFIISDDGYILTNNHVVGGADRVKVVFADKREFQAKIVGTDPRTDLAIVKIDAKNLPVLSLGNSDQLQPGEWVLAIGSPFGLPGTVTSGIVSATGRSSMGITDYEDFIQTDAAINPGNSGGPLVNMRGEAVGVNTAIFSRNGGYMGIGFAIPINLAKDIVKQLIETGSVTRGYLGVVIQQLTPELAESFGFKETNGVLVGDVSKGSPGDKAGLKPGDVIVALNGDAVGDIGRFRNRVAAVSPDAKVELTVVRDGKRTTVPVTVGELPAAETLAGSRPAASPAPSTLGLAVQSLTGELAKEYGYENESGVIVTDVQSGSPAAAAGIRPGTLIKQVNRRTVNSADEFRQAVDEAKGRAVVLLVRTDQYARFVVIERGE